MSNMDGFTGSVSTNDGGDNQGDDPANSPRKWKQKDNSDARKGEGSGDYPNYWSHKTRSGHSFIMDDSKGHETVTLQHRSGTAIQMGPDGSLHLTTHNGRYDITFGENRMTVSGAQDITVKGDASMRVFGDYNTTVHGNYNLTVMGDFNMTARNHNRQIRGNIDTEAKNETKKIEGSSAKTAQGAMTIASKGNMTVASQGAKTNIGAAKGLHMAVPGEEGDITMEVKNKGNVHMKTNEGKFDAVFSDGQNEVKIMAKEGDLHMKAKKNMNFEAETNNIQMKSQQDIGMDAQQKVQVSSQAGTEIKSQQDIHVNAQGDAAVEGSSTHVGRTAGTTHIVGATTNVEGSGALNLNGGLGQMFSGQFSFNFGDILNASGMPSVAGQRADQPEEDPYKGKQDQWNKSVGAAGVN